MGIRILVPRPRRRGGVPRASKFVWAALAVALWGTAYFVFGAGGMAGVFRARAEVDRLQQELIRAREANRELEHEIEALRHDPIAVEQLAREQLYLAKPGEKVYLLPPLPEAETGTPESGVRIPAEAPGDDSPQQQR